MARTYSVKGHLEMTVSITTRRIATVLSMMAVIGVPSAWAQETKPYVPTVGQPGKDVVWVPTPTELVEKMLDLAKVTPQDFVIDLGSGDGRNVIGAAKRGAQALGVEYNADMVELSRRNAQTEGVADKATFVQGDMYQADISKASVMALFLLTNNMDVLRPKFLDLAPGSRIVSNTFGITGWTPDQTEVLTNCPGSWCTALLWIVPAKVAGTWNLAQGELRLTQEYQLLTGSLGSQPISDGKLNGSEITFTVGNSQYTGRVTGNTMEGSVNGQRWTATRRQ
jgi:SAM-dependent methyltransferase